MTSANGFLYSQINVFCILIILVILFKSLHSLDRRESFRIYQKLLGFLILYLLCDMCWGMIDSGNWTSPVWFNYLINDCYFISLGMASFCCFQYAEYIHNPAYVKNRNYYLSFIPLLLLIILIISSNWTGLIFSIDSANHYHRGILYHLQQVLSYGYLIFAIGKIIYRFTKKEYYAKHNEYMAMLSFYLPPLLAGVLQVIYQGFPILCMGITIGVLLASINSNELLISLDPLTQMNNRNQMIQYLSGKLSGKNRSNYLFLLMMDVDYFKKINDQYGHNEGDRALVEISDVLKEVCGQYNCFGARYGGDEFVIIFESDEEETVQIICNAIKERLAKKVSEHGLKYNLKVSIGHALYKESISNIPDFIALADTELYKVKKARNNKAK